MTYKTKDRVTRTPLKAGGELRWYGMVGSSCSTSDIRHVNLVTNLVISHERGKAEKCLRQVEHIRGHLWHIFHNGQPTLNNSRFGDFVDRIYPIEFEIKDTTDTDRSASFLDLHLEIDSEGRLRTKLYDKSDGFNFPIVNFPFICSNISAALAYGVYISVDTIF
jgi:hypothetical protein